MSQCLQIWLRLSSHCFAEHRGAGTSGTSSPIRGRYLEAGAETPTTRHINLHLPSPTNVTPSPVGEGRGEGEQHPLSPPPSCRRRNVTPYTDTGPVPRYGRGNPHNRPPSPTRPYLHPTTVIPDADRGSPRGTAAQHPSPTSTATPHPPQSPRRGWFQTSLGVGRRATRTLPAIHPFTNQNTVRTPRRGGFQTHLG